MKTKSGFTLVEILIVVVILGILAAIVIPQFTEASTEAKTSSLVSDLQTIRSQIELFKIQHNDLYPGQADAASDIVPATFVTDLTGQTTVGTKTFGPYLQKMPSNQFVNGSGINGAAADSSPEGWTIVVDHTSATFGKIVPVASSAYPATLDPSTL
jgi:general secretion pathway protein G